MNRARTSFTTWLQPFQGRIMIGFVLIVGLYFVLSFGEQAWRSQELNAEVDQRRAQIEELRDERDALGAQLTEYSSARYDAYVEQAARRDLNLAYPGETVVLVRWNEPPEAPAEEAVQDDDSSPLPNWRRWLDFLS